jgi:hypothetical protein
LGGIWEGIQNFFGGTSAGGWIGGVLGVGLAWFASNMFGAGPFRSIMMIMLMPLLFMLGRNMGNDWGGQSTDAPAAGTTPERSPTTPERVRTPAAGASVNRVMTPEEAQAMTADLQGMLSGASVTAAPTTEQTDPTVLANIVPQDVTIRTVQAR